MYCGYCHRRLRIMKLTGGRLYYYCPNQKLSSNNECLSGSVSNDVLEKIVLEEIIVQITKLADRVSIRKKAAEERRIIIRKTDKEILDVEAGITELLENKAGLLEAYHEGIYTREQYMEYRRQLEQQLSEKQRQQQLRRQLDTCNDLLYADAKECELLLQYAGFKNLTKEMVDAFVDKIEISNGKAIDIYWRFNNRDDSGDNNVTTTLRHPSAEEAIMY